MPELILKISGVKEGESIPSKFTCDGEDINPLIEIGNVPEGTKSLALVLDDPDATTGGIWDHWVVWNIDPRTQYIHENSIPGGAVEGTTSFGKREYGGPCPPKGDKAHRYRFKVYALDTLLNLDPTAGRVELEKAMENHIIAKAQLTALYQR